VSIHTHIYIQREKKWKMNDGVGLRGVGKVNRQALRTSSGVVTSLTISLLDSKAASKWSSDGGVTATNCADVAC